MRPWHFSHSDHLLCEWPLPELLLLEVAVAVVVVVVVVVVSVVVLVNHLWSFLLLSTPCFFNLLFKYRLACVST
jgi:hypothetical protein